MKSVFENYISKRNSIEVLKAIALAQLKPENHGKNIRLEMIQALTIKNLNSVKSSLNLDGLSAFLNENFESDYREDPPENLFTGNIQFHNGNNIVFPGIANDIIEMNQSERIPT